ncbi:hypothetical protein OF83DRAFT_1058720 [Amylostereum chailletii]|nr:hypothetical protein OF83DRAFT_1058720 [Amylostereum chailletii]
MSNAPLPTYYSHRGSWTTPSKFKEHLSLATVYLDDQPAEHSRFSPDTPNALQLEQAQSPPPTNSIFSFGSSTLFKTSPQFRPRDLEQGSVGMQSPRSATTFRDRMTKLFFEVRSGHRPPELDLPIQQSELAPWPPLNVKKTHVEEHGKDEHPLKKWRRRFLYTFIVLVLLFLLVNAIVVDVRLSALSHTGSSPSVAPASPSSSAAALSSDVQQCLSEYTLNAPSSPTTYPCSTCLPLLSQVPADASADYTTALDATQFCGLRAFWEDAGSTGRSALETSGWVQDVRFCAWGGVRCDGSGRVSYLQLTAPAIPASIPAEIGNLTGLATFQVIGDNTSPSGPLPSSFASLASLSSLHIESTGISSSLPDGLQALTTLTLVRNPNLSQQLPESLVQAPLRSLIVNNETLSLSADQQNTFCNMGKLSTCDLRGTGIQSCGSCLVG